MSEHRIIQGDVLAGLRTLPDRCVQCTVTSPPYYGLRNYGVDGQIGLEETPEQFIAKMVEVFREVRRVTRDDGILWLNLGDSYASTNPRHNHNGEGALTGSNLKNKELSAPNEFIPLPEGYKAKDLMGIPWRVAFALQADGWYFRSAIPWIKRNCMPESTTDRPTSAIEYIFLMTKSAKYFYDSEAIRCPAAGDVDRKSFRGGGKYTAGQSFYNSEPVGNQTHGNKKRKQDQTGNPTYTGFNERWNNQKQSKRADLPANQRVSWGKREDGTPIGDGQTRNYRNSDPFFESWQGLYSESENPLAFIINPQARPELHFATFPDLLAETCIKAGTSEYGCCPKCGAPWKRIVEASGGTTGKSWHPHADDETTGKITSPEMKDGYVRQFKGWQPSCKCYPDLLPGQLPPQALKPCVVLDPFMGSGTVAYVARELNRSSIGCELNPAYVKIIKKRLDAGSQLDTGVVSYRFEKVSGTAGKR